MGFFSSRFGDSPEVAHLKDSVQRMQDKLKASERALDPDLTANIETDAKSVTPASPTTAPHRFTVYVPHDEETVLNLGMAGPRLDDDGITGKTKSHVHFQVTSATPTVVSLGSPASSVKDPAGIDGVPSRMKGYAMVTKGNAWHESEGQQYLVSSKADVVLQTLGTGTALVQSGGDLEVGAGHSVTMGGTNVTIAGDSGITIEPAPKYGESIPKQMGMAMSTNAEEKVAGAVDLTQQLVSFAAGFTANPVEEPSRSKPGWEKVVDWANVGLGALNTLGSAFRYWHSNYPQGVTGKVDIYASKYASIHGGVHTSIYGRANVGITSPANVSMLSATVGAVGLASASLWAGVSASVTAVKTADLISLSGDARVWGRRAASLSANNEVIVQGGKVTTISSKEGLTSVFGATGVHVSSGDSEGYGVQVKPDRVSFGHLSSGASAFDGSGALDDKHEVTIDATSTRIRHGMAAFTFQEKDIRLSATADNYLQLSGSGAVIDGKTVQLG